MLNLFVFILMVPMIVGILLGYFSRERKKIKVANATLWAILVLIFSLGFSIGSDSQLLDSMPRVGLNALITSVLVIAFSIIFVGFARRRVSIG